jgi:hypothetical protein
MPLQCRNPRRTLGDTLRRKLPLLYTRPSCRRRSSKRAAPSARRAGHAGRPRHLFGAHPGVEILGADVA